MHTGSTKAGKLKFQVVEHTQPNGTEVALLLNHTFHATGVRDNDDTKYINEWITLFSPTIVMTYGEPLNLDYSLGNGTGIQGIQGIQGAAGGGSSSNAWYGSQAEFNALQHPDPDTTYYIQDKLNFSEIEGSIDYSQIANRPISLGQLINSPGYQTKNDVKTLIEKAIDENIPKEKWVTQAEYDLLVANNMLEGGVKYHIEGPQTTLQMIVTFTDETTATYNVYIG
jgi:hypothetical protein